jgi:hypothetical protein
MLDCVPQSLSTRPPFLCLPIRLLFSYPYSRTFFFQVPIRLRSIWHKIVIVGLALEPSAVVEKLSRVFSLRARFSLTAKEGGLAGIREA